MNAFTFLSHNEKDTAAAASVFSSLTPSSTVISLDGGLAAGKTTFIRAFAEALGTDEPVTSPTYTIIHEYRTASVPLYHMDWYRLSGPAEVADTGAQEYFGQPGICLIEWGLHAASILPPNTWFISITVRENTDRLFTVRIPREETAVSMVAALFDTKLTIESTQSCETHPFPGSSSDV